MDFDPLTDEITEELTWIDGTKLIRSRDFYGNARITASIYDSTRYDPTSSTTWITASSSSGHWGKAEKDELPKMHIDKSEDPLHYNHRYSVACDDAKDLAQNRILKTLSIMKSRLMMECAPVHVQHIECRMTPLVKRNIIQAYRRLNMYGKKTPFIARFDEYGRRLEDEVKIETLSGMVINIVDPEHFGPLYLDFMGVIEK